MLALRCILFDSFTVRARVGGALDLFRDDQLRNKLCTTNKRHHIFPKDSEILAHVWSVSSAYKFSRLDLDMFSVTPPPFPSHALPLPPDGLAWPGFTQKRSRQENWNQSMERSLISARNGLWVRSLTVSAAILLDWIIVSCCQVLVPTENRRYCVADVPP